MKCTRCGQWTERFTVDQRRCLRCEAEVARIVEQDAARRSRRVWPFAKELTGARA